MKFAGARPRSPGPLRRRPLVKLLAPDIGNLGALSGRERRGFVRCANQDTKQEVGWLLVQSGERNEAAQICQMMDSNTLFAGVFAHDFHHGRIGLRLPRMDAIGMGPKYRESQLRESLKPNSHTSPDLTWRGPNGTCASSLPALSLTAVRLSRNFTPLTATAPGSTVTASPGNAPISFATGSAPAGQSPRRRYPRVSPSRAIVWGRHAATRVPRLTGAPATRR